MPLLPQTAYARRGIEQPGRGSNSRAEDPRLSQLSLPFADAHRAARQIADQR